MPRITPCLWFDGQAEEAAKFYTSVFKKSKIKEVTRSGDAGPGPKGGVMTVSFELDGQPFLALNGGPQFRFNEAVSLVVRCKSQKRVDEYWAKLTEGGEESMCGWLKDRFGLSWQIVPTALPKLLAQRDPAKARRVMDAMLKMRKLDVAALERAAKGEAPAPAAAPKPKQKRPPTRRPAALPERGAKG